MFACSVCEYSDAPSACASCAQPIKRGREHAHPFNSQAGDLESICGECWGLLLVSSSFALEHYGAAQDSDPSLPSFLEAVHAGRIALYTQPKLPT